MSLELSFRLRKIELSFFFHLFTMQMAASHGHCSASIFLERGHIWLQIHTKRDCFCSFWPREDRQVAYIRYRKNGREFQSWLSRSTNFFCRSAGSSGLSSFYTFNFQTYLFEYIQKRKLVLQNNCDKILTRYSRWFVGIFTSKWSPKLWHARTCQSNHLCCVFVIKTSNYDHKY